MTAEYAKPPEAFIRCAAGMVPARWDAPDDDRCPIYVRLQHYRALAAENERLRKIPPSVRDVIAERQRQIAQEGWVEEHDDEHTQGEIAKAAACYALAGTSADEAHYIHGRRKDMRDLFWLRSWGREWWKPTARRRNLVKAGALILAEIERLDRATQNLGDNA